MEKIFNIELKIDYLKHHIEAIPELASIWYQVLGSIWSPDTSLEKVIKRFEEHLNDQQLPLTLVAFLDYKPIGMCSLRVNDGIREDLSPWLGSLVVHPEYQRQGIAVKLIDAIKQKAKLLNFKELFLFTFDPTLPEYYAKLGWIDIGIDNFQNKKVTLMKVML